MGNFTLICVNAVLRTVNKIYSAKLLCFGSDLPNKVAHVMRFRQLHDRKYPQKCVAVAQASIITCNFVVLV